MNEVDLAKRLIEALESLAEEVRGGYEVAREPGLRAALKEADAILAYREGLASCLLTIERGRKVSSEPQHGDRQ